MRGRKQSRDDGGGNGNFSVHPRTFIFFDKTTRTQRFEVKARANGSMPAEEAASLLAMQCVLHGQTPEDFAVVVPIGGDLPNGLERRAKRLIEACVAMHSDVLLSPRQHEVLQLVLQDRANKEISVELQIGVRTVKFHISALLAKFGVADRGCLAKKTRDLMSSSGLTGKLTLLQPVVRKIPEKPQVRNSRESPLRLNVFRKQSSG